MKYPFIKKENLKLHITCDDCTVLHAMKYKQKTDKLKELIKTDEWRFPPITALYLMKCDGKTSHQDITKSLKLPFSILGDRILEGLEEIDIVGISEEEIKSNNLEVSGSFNSYCPEHISIEITDHCNFRCKHCYASASPDKVDHVSWEKLLGLLEKLRDNGVRVIELTGGECTTYPHFKEALEFCANNFLLVSVVSNGYLIGKHKELAQFISSFKNVVVQISIDGMQEFQDTFRNKENAFLYACQGAKYLKENGTFIRISSTVTSENIDQVDELHDLCEELGVDAWATSIAEEFGRGSELEPTATKIEVQKELLKRLEKYNEDPLFAYISESVNNFVKNRHINCGGGWRTFAINATSGDVRTCLFLSKHNSIGNIYEDEYYEIFKEEITMKFKNAPNPSKTLSVCKDCKYIEDCGGCFAKALRVAAEVYPECPWKKKYLQGI